MTRVTLTNEYILIETENIDFSVLRKAVERYNVKYTVLVKNSMFAYEREQLVEIYADSEQEALDEAQKLDIHAEVKIISFEDV